MTRGHSQVFTMAAIVARLTRRRRQREALSLEYDYETSKVGRAGGREGERERGNKVIPIY